MQKVNILPVYVLFLFFSGCANNSNPDPEPAVNKPIVLFIAIDDLNDWTGYLGGHPRAQTPNLDRLVDSGTAFLNAYPPSPSCGPSRTALLYGRHPHETGAYGNDDFYSPFTLRCYGNSTAIPDIFRNQKSIVSVFRENGYYTAGAGKLSHFTQTPRFPKNTVLISWMILILTSI